MNIFLPLPVPASVYGMILMLIALLTGIIKLPQVEETAGFLLDIMPIFFVGPTVRLMNEYGVISSSLVPFLIVCTVSTLVTLLLTGYVAQFVIKVTGPKSPDSIETVSGEVSEVVSGEVSEVVSEEEDKR